MNVISEWNSDLRIGEDLLVDVYIGQECIDHEISDKREKCVSIVI